MRRYIRLIILFLALAIAALLWFNWQSPNTAVTTNAALETLLISDGNEDNFARATESDAIVFPRDLGPHESFQTEWWYYTGNLAAEDGRQFGYQFTIFRRALESQEVTAVANDGSQFRSDQIYLAHFTISDIAEETFYEVERFSRGAAGLAGAQAEPYRVWLEDWSAQEITPDTVQIQAATNDVALDITLQQTMSPVLHGDDGLSAKGAEPGNASYYYSFVQQETVGSLSVLGETYQVTGKSWKDHEYSTSVLSPDSVGWDWFSLQFDDGTALMLFQIRRDDGTLEPASSGSFIAADGAVQHLTAADWQLDVLDTWTSPVSSAAYPAEWQLVIPAIDLDIRGAPLMADQELNLSSTYWEGAVSFAGTSAGQAVNAAGYIEMTGYVGESNGRFQGN